MAEESKLGEEVVETKESTEVKEEFNPLAFSGDDTYGENEEKKEVEETEESDTKEVEAKEEKSEEEIQEDGWSWDSKNETEDKEKEEEYDWDGTSTEKTEEAPTAQEALNWAKVGEELGIALYKHLVKDRSIR